MKNKASYDARDAIAKGQVRRHERWNAVAEIDPYVAAVMQDEKNLNAYFPTLLNNLVIQMPLIEERKELLRPPQLTIRTGRTLAPFGLVIQATPTSTILILDVGLSIWIRDYTIAASTYFLPSKADVVGRKKGRRPSKEWDTALPAISTRLDWLCSSVGAPIGPPMINSDYQRPRAASLARWAEMFALAHELHHVITVGDVKEPETVQASVDDIDVGIVTQSSDTELSADAGGMQIIMRTIAEADPVGALSGSLYLLHAVGLREKFIHAAGLADPSPHAHPHAELRIAVVKEVARQLEGPRVFDGMEVLDSDLRRLDSEILKTTCASWEKATDEIQQVMVAVANSVVSSADRIDLANAPDYGEALWALEIRRNLFVSPSAVTSWLKTMEAVARDDGQTIAWQRETAILAKRVVFGLGVAFQELIASVEDLGWLVDDYGLEDSGG